MDINDLRQGVRSRLDDGDFTLLYLWIRFRAKGGLAGREDLDAFVDGTRELSDSDALVLGSVAKNLGYT